MPGNDLLKKFAFELSERLNQFGFKKRPLTIKSHGREKYCVVSSLKIESSQANVFAFEGPYLGGSRTLWAGFGSRSIKSIQWLREQCGGRIKFCPVSYDDWNSYVLMPAVARAVVRSENFACEDYRHDTKWIWLGRYFNSEKNAASKAAGFIVPAARSQLFLGE